MEQTGHRPRVYTCGSFDLMNHGTVALFKKIKTLIPSCELMVGCYSDDDILAKKGMNVLYEGERLKGLQFCKYVDLIYFPAPWIHDFDFFEENEIDFVTGEINGWDLDLLHADEEAIHHFVDKKKVCSPKQDEQPHMRIIRHQLEKGLKLKIYAQSKFNELKNKIFALPEFHDHQGDAAHNMDIDAGIMPPSPSRHRRLLERQQSSSTLRSFERDEDEKKSLKSKDRQQEHARESKLETKSRAGNDALSRQEYSQLAKGSKSEKSHDGLEKAAKVKQDQPIVEAQSIIYIEAAKNLLTELASHDMYLPVHVEQRIGASEIIIRILRDRNAFYERSIRQGYSRDDLNLSIYDYLKFKVKIWLQALCKKFKG